MTPTQLKTVFWFAVIVWAVLLWVDNQPLTTSLIQPATWVLLAMGLLVTFFEKVAWKWKVWRWPSPWLVNTPNLGGTYKGLIHTHWEDPVTKQRPAPIPAILVVQQTLTTIYVRLFTAESESESLAASIEHAKDGTSSLFYTYRNDPRQEVRHRSSIHYGGVKFSIGGAEDRLEGGYWTDRKTVGEMSFTRASRKRVTNFQEGLALL